MQLAPARTTTSALSPFWNETPIRTYLFDALSLLLPSGEAFVVDAVEAVIAPADAELAQACRDLVAEEQNHQRAHRRYNDRLAEQGYDLAPRERAIAADLARLSAGLSADRRLCLAAAFEHITATIARCALRDPELLAQSDAPQCRTWRWHCAAEVAHVSVTRDLLAHRDVGYAARVGWFLLASLLLAGDVLRLVRTMYAQDRARQRVGAWLFRKSIASLAVHGAGSLTHIAAGWAGYWLPRRGTAPRKPAAQDAISVCVRTLRQTDVPELIRLEARCWTVEQAACEGDLRLRIASQPELSVGAFCSRTGAALASLFMKPTDQRSIAQATTWLDCARRQPKRQTGGAAPNALFGISLSSVDPAAAKAVFEYFWPRALKGGWRHIYLGSPIPGLRAWLARHPEGRAEDYVHRRRAGLPLDPQLRYYHRRGFRRVVAVHAGYFPHADSLDHGVLLRGTIPGSMLAPLWRLVPLERLDAARAWLFKLL
jgi:predicted metal-dependent hydrolase